VVEFAPLLRGKIRPDRPLPQESASVEVRYRFATSEGEAKIFAKNVANASRRGSGGDVCVTCRQPFELAAQSPDQAGLCLRCATELGFRQSAQAVCQS
jgi:hypothetical protein